MYIVSINVPKTIQQIIIYMYHYFITWKEQSRVNIYRSKSYCSIKELNDHQTYHYQKCKPYYGAALISVY